jgi:tetratricopeptide (TPR) repeat protein
VIDWQHPGRWWESRLFPHLLFLLVVAAVFGNTLANGFVWDDYPLIVASDTYRTIDLARFFTTPANGLEYLPLRDLSVAIDYALWGLDPRGYHGTNLVLYLANVSAVYWFARSAAAFLAPETDRERQRFIGLGCALLFCLHPLHSQTVSFVTCRNTLLSGLFAFLAAGSFLRCLDEEGRRRCLFYAAAAGCYLLALLSKGTSIFLPLFFLPCVFLGRRRRLLPALGLLLPLLLLSGAAANLFTRIARETNIIDNLLSRHGGLAGQRLLEALQIPFFYLGKLLLPVRLSPDYGLDFSQFSHTLASSAVIGAGLAVVVASVVALLGARRFPAGIFCLAWYATALLPVLHLIPTATVVADRYAYLPSFAFTFLLAAGGERLSRSRGRVWFVAAALLAGLIWGGLAFRHNRVWHDDVSLWEHTAAVSPYSQTALDNLGWIYFGRGDLARAGTYFERASRLDPGDPVAVFFQGYLAFDRHDYASALRLFKSAYANRNDLVDALFYIGRTAEAAGDRDQAIDYYRYVLSSTAPGASDYRGQAAERLRLLGAGR